MTETVKNNPWDHIETPTAEYHTRLVETDSTHILKWGKDQQGHCLLIIELNGNLVELYQAQKMSLIGMSTDLRDLSGKQLFILKLERSIDIDLFHALCSTLIEKISRLEDSAILLSVTFQHLKRWKAFLASGTKGLLTPEEQRGLFCEIRFLDLLLGNTRMSEAEAVAAWNGPDKLQQDFIYYDRAVEIKSLYGTSKNAVRISSEDQLESVCTHLYLCVFRISDQSDSDNAMSLHQLVEYLGKKLNGDNAVDFHEKLGAAGYVPLNEYKSPKYIVNSTSCFRVQDDFPRIVRSNLPSAIQKVSYEIQLNHLAKYECSKENLWGQCDG